MTEVSDLVRKDFLDPIGTPLIGIWQLSEVVGFHGQIEDPSEVDFLAPWSWWIDRDLGECVDPSCLVRWSLSDALQCFLVIYSDHRYQEIDRCPAEEKIYKVENRFGIEEDPEEDQHFGNRDVFRIGMQTSMCKRSIDVSIGFDNTETHPILELNLPDSAMLYRTDFAENENYQQIDVVKLDSQDILKRHVFNISDYTYFQSYDLIYNRRTEP